MTEALKFSDPPTRRPPPGKNHNLTAFNAAIDRAADKEVPDMFRKWHIRIGLEALQRIVMKTPVDTGRARGGWQVSLGGPTGGGGGEDKSGGSTIAAGQSVIMSVPAFGLIVIGNNVIYIEVLEKGGYPNPPETPGFNEKGETLTVEGFSRQAPRGMVGITFEELVAMLGATTL